jgi:hypothetical protein
MSWRTARRAKDSLGIKPAKTRFDGGWTWALPAKMTKMAEDVHPTTDGHLRQNPHSKAIFENKNAEDGQPKKVDTFGEVGHLRESEPEDDVEVFEVPE